MRLTHRISTHRLWGYLTDSIQLCLTAADAKAQILNVKKQFCTKRDENMSKYIFAKRFFYHAFIVCLKRITHRYSALLYHTQWRNQEGGLRGF